ncbi:hypothetical protein I317_02412 [Kwoniella heveanensis CBS 569]|nr:hypothetical protein I317_02412 [Kwoniella heveanensis CBS 569]
MRAWLENEKSSVIGGERVDLLNCALLSFGNSIRDDASATILLPTILPDILPLLVPSAPGTTQHSLIGLLKNLSIPTPNKVLLGDAGVIERLYNMRVFGEERDLLGSVQGGAAGILKNLCKGNVVNTLRLLSLSLDNEDEVSSPNQDQNEDNDQDQDEDQKQQQTPQTRTKGSLEPILALIKRTDDPALRFECTRIFVNIIKSLAAPVPATPTQQPKLSPQPAPASIPSSRLSHTIQPMVHMLRDAGEYPVLQQEAVIALTLLATFWPDTSE